MGNAAFAARGVGDADPIARGKRGLPARAPSAAWHSLLLPLQRRAELPLRASPLQAPAGREVNQPGKGEMGPPDSSPNKWNLKEQRNTYLQWFSLADEDGDGRLTGNDALKFFAMSNLSKPELKQVDLA
nr:unnamed protein product [Digitaria exilis]